MDDLGNKVRKIRKDRGLTLAQLADKVGCSPSYICSIELSKASPSLDTLKKIADSLKVAIVEFFVSAEDRSKPVVIHENERIKINGGRWKTNIYLLVRSTHRKRMEPFYSVFQPGEGPFGLHKHEGEEFGFVIKGELEIHLNDDVYRVKENESFYYSSDIPHGWINPTDKETILIWVGVGTDPSVLVSPEINSAEWHPTCQLT